MVENGLVIFDVIPELIKNLIEKECFPESWMQLGRLEKKYHLRTAAYLGETRDLIKWLDNQLTEYKI